VHNPATQGVHKVLRRPIIWVTAGTESVTAEFKGEPDMKVFGTQWERIRTTMTPSTMRLGLALVSIVAMVFAGAAGEHWT
jgi:hypothetical protein